MGKLISESYEQFLNEKKIDMVSTIIDVFKQAGYKDTVLDDSLRPDIDQTELNASIDLIVDMGGKEKDYISITVLSGVVYWNDFNKNKKLGDINDPRGLVKGINKVFK